jgi:hypothetical protein
VLGVRRIPRGTTTQNIRKEVVQAFRQPSDRKLSDSQSLVIFRESTWCDQALSHR